MVDRLLSQQNYRLLVNGLDSKDLEFKNKCINGLLEAAKCEMNQGLLANQEIIQKLVHGLVGLKEYPSCESKSLHALYLLNIDGIFC